MTTPETISYIGYRQEQTRNVDPIDGNSPYNVYYKFGKLPYTWGNFANKNPRYAQNYYGDNVEIYSQKLVSTAPSGMISYLPVNLQMFQYVLGVDNYSYAGGVHTFAKRDVFEELPTMTVRQEAGSKRESLNYGMVHQLSFGIDLTQKNQPLTEDVIILGSELKAPTLSTTLAPTFPNSLSDTYSRTSGMIFNWDQGGGGETDLTGKGNLLNISFVLNNASWHDDDNHSIDPLPTEGPINIYGVNFEVTRTSDLTLYNDFIDGDLDHDIKFKIFNTATNYREITLTDLSMEITRNAVIMKNGDKIPTWLCKGIGTALTVTGKDGLTDDYYNYGGGA